MEKIKKSQISKLVLVASLLTITFLPISSKSLRSAYIFFIVNALIASVAAEAGLFSLFHLKSADQNNIKKLQPSSSSAAVPVVSQKRSNTDKLEAGYGKNIYNNSPNEETSKNHVKSAKKKKGTLREADHIIHGQKVKKSPPSIFFIGGEKDHLSEDEEEDLGGKELFQKAEIFIGNFYKQLKIQREDSWKKLHDFYRKTF